jgi:hypothetical protein
MKECNILNLLPYAFFPVAGVTFLSSHLQYTHTRKLQTCALGIHLSRLGGLACVAGKAEGPICILLILQVSLAEQ